MYQKTPGVFFCLSFVRWSVPFIYSNNPNSNSVKISSPLEFSLSTFPNSVSVPQDGLTRERRRGTTKYETSRTYVRNDLRFRHNRTPPGTPRNIHANEEIRNPTTIEPSLRNERERNHPQTGDTPVWKPDGKGEGFRTTLKPSDSAHLRNLLRLSSSVGRDTGRALKQS